MEIQEKLKKNDRLLSQETDVRKEVGRMREKQSRQLTKLRESFSGNTLSAALIRATEAFKTDLKAFLDQHGASDLYTQLTTGILPKRVSEIVSKTRDRSQNS